MKKRDMEVSVEFPEGFEEEGFLGAGIVNGIVELRDKNADLFQIAEKTNTVLMRTVKTATAAAQTTPMAPEAVAARVLLRSCGTFQGIILLTEWGMVAEGRMLVRSLIENAFCIAALIDNPETFMEMLKRDSEASRQNQRKFILAQELVDDDAKRDQLQAVIEDIDKIGKPRLMGVKKVAELGPLLTLYLAYQRLSDDAVHLSARSLHRHVMFNAEHSGWCYKVGAGDQGENATTLHYAVRAILGIGVGITQMLEDKEGNAAFGELSDRFHELPSVQVI